MSLSGSIQTRNGTRPTEFILLGLTDEPALQVPLFIFFLLIYIGTLLFNIGIMILVWKNLHLHTPMYFLLFCLSFVDLCVSSIAVPNMLVNFFSSRKAISFAGCVTQTFSSLSIGGTEVFLLAVMSYDRYTAICNPLLYPVIMSKRACIYLVVSISIIGVLNSLIHVTLTFTLPFCESNKITHFCCDVPPVLKLSCSDTTLNDVVLMVVSGGLIVVSFIIILISYMFIGSALLKISSSEGRKKTLSTCSAHFVSVVMFFGTIIFMYAKPNSGHTMSKDRVVSVFYMVIIPMLNPMIYSLRNKEMKRALRKLIQRTRGNR